VITTLPDGNTTRSDYGGSAVTLTDQVNRKIKRESDGLGRLIKVTEQTSAGLLAQETSYSYSLLDKLILVNQGNQGRAYKYDALGRLLYEKIPEQTATINDGTGTMWTSAYAYTEYSAVKKKRDARGVESHYAYDALHQMTQTWFTGVGGDDGGYVRPALPTGVAATKDRIFAYTSWGSLSSVTIPSEYTETYGFDDFFRVFSVTRWILGQTYSVYKTYTTSYEYNRGNQLSKMIYPSGQQVEVNHDDKGRLQSLSGYLTAMSYGIAGQVTGLTLGNGVVESYGYDANRLQLTTQTATKSGNQLMNLTYNYQATAGQMGAGSTAGNAGQLMSINGTINSTTESAAYTYDLLARLVTSDQTSNGSSAQRLFEYDRWGNRTAVYDGLPGGKTPPTQIQSVTFPTTFQQGGSAPTNRIGSVTNNGLPVNYTYDAAGNVTNDGAHSYTYDAENRLVSVDGGATAQYRYDHQNRRVTKIVGSNWTHYVWMGSQVIGEHDATTPYSTNPTYQVQSARKDYIYGGENIIHTRQRSSSTSPWTTRYSLSDRLSVRIVLDTSGNLIGRQAHLPFGEDFGESGTQENHHLASYERDSESGSDYAVNRQYSQITGRFNRSDPLAASGKKGFPQSWNRYAYTENDPINMRDPLGLDDWGDPCGSRSVVPLEDGWGFNFSYNGPVLSTPPIECWKPFARDPEPEPAPESEPSCTLHVETTKGARITDFTPEVGLKFPGGQNVLGPAAWGFNQSHQLVTNGYFWNTYIFATITDSSGLVGTWTARQEAWIKLEGTFWNGTDPKSAFEASQSFHFGPDQESPPNANQWRTADLLAWIDDPGLDPNPFADRMLYPYNLRIHTTLESWVELEGRRICSKTWSIDIHWKKGKLKEWEAN
jgi:RHS repeat-associated protein